MVSVTEALETIKQTLITALMSESEVACAGYNL